MLHNVLRKTTRLTLPIHRVGVAALFSASLLFIGGLATPVQAADPTVLTAEAPEVQETTLNAQGELHDLNLSPQGDLIISDTGGETIWVVNPKTSAATRYSGLGPVEDAQADASGAIWWTDGADRFGRLIPSTLQQTVWQVVSDEQAQLLALAFDSSGQVWLSEWFGNTSKLYRFQPASRELCAHSLPGGTTTMDMRQHAGELWLANWFENQIIRYTPSNRQLTSWKISQDLLPGGLALDEQGHLWWADSETPGIGRFNPANHQWTHYPLPVGVEATALTFQGQRIGYTDALSGMVGLLDPTKAISASSALTLSTTTVTPVCVTLNAGTTTPVTMTISTLQWTDVSATALHQQPDWAVYQLPTAAKPFGIVNTAGYLWVTDQGAGRQKLLRIKAAAPLNKLYLSLIQR